MGHNVVKHSFGRKDGPRKALRKGLIISLIEHGRIRTTLSKAKETRRHVEKAITLGKKGDLNSRRILISRLGNIDAVEKLMSDISKRFLKRPGGYTRIVKAGLRPGDVAPMALLEFVDYQLPDKSKDNETKVKGDKTAKAKSRQRSKAVAQAKKSATKNQASSRRKNRR